MTVGRSATISGQGQSTTVNHQEMFDAGDSPASERMPVLSAAV